MASGSVYRRKDGRWCASVQVAGRRRTVYAKTEAQARRKLADLLRSLGQSGMLATPGKRTVNDLLDAWLETAELRPKTRAGYEQALNCYVRPVLGRMRLSRLDPADLERLLRTLPGKRVPQVVYRRLHRALAQAVRWGWLATNPADRVTPPRYTPPRRELWSAAQLRAFLEGVSGHRYEALFITALATGLRLGELLGLRWSDVDFAAQTITVCHAVSEVKGQRMTLPPKTQAGLRTITLPPQAVQVLRRWRASQGRQRLLAGSGWQAGDAVFTTHEGRPLAQSTVQHAFRRLCVRLGLPPVGLHGLRHLHATLLLAEGLPIAAVSARLGHANPSVTLAVYAHALPAQDKEAAAAMAKVLP